MSRDVLMVVLLLVTLLMDAVFASVLVVETLVEIPVRILLFVVYTLKCAKRPENYVHVISLKPTHYFVTIVVALAFTKITSEEAVVVKLIDPEGLEPEGLERDVIIPVVDTLADHADAHVNQDLLMRENAVGDVKL
mmetsp:Transcript_85889/g.119239  ORF Transcript_85889/g.119239 Transcript_85889/m.119239 type:complete len:136 (-) Transcript_85889:65-472(-)